MTFTYDLGTPDDNTRVRFHLGDTVEASAMFSDEEIAFVIDEEGTYQLAVISLIQGAMARLAQEPDMTADWLRIDWRRSAENWKRLLDEKRRKFGYGLTLTVSTAHPWRPDLGMCESPEYDDASLFWDDDDCP